MPYIPNTTENQKEMLKRIGVEKLEDLFDTIPEALRLKRPLDIPAYSEMELLNRIKGLAGGNRNNLVCFAGGGVYDHFIPSALEVVLSRPEFMTAYTPYQAEVSQGTLQIIYEFQTHICRLTGMDVANASMYDGSTAAAEALILAINFTKRKKLVISETVNPLYREVIQTYLSGQKVDIVTIPASNGRSDITAIKEAIDEQTAAVLLAQPNFFGLLEDIELIEPMIHEVKGKLILAVDPIAQSLLKTPAEYGVDIVVGEGQPMGITVSFGGPLLGFFAAKEDLIRFMPGRIASRTVDVDGKNGYVLTLQTREQHIRREKATSNICTNQALCATAASIYISLMGKQGLREVALLSTQQAHKLYQKISALEGFEPYFEGSFVREFAIKTPRPTREIILALIEKSILPGVDAGRWYNGLEDCLIIAATEKRSDEEIDCFVNALKEVSQSAVVSSM